MNPTKQNVHAHNSGQAPRRLSPTNMTAALQGSSTLPLVRDRVRRILTQSQAFRSLPPEKRHALAHDMVKVAQYIVGGQTGDNTPAAVALVGGAELPKDIPKPGSPASTDIQAEAARQGGTALAELVREVNFPQFVAGLIDGVFTAIVDASIKQMEAYAELVKNVAKSVDQYMKDNVSENQARDYLANSYPDFLEVDINGEEPKLKPTDDYDEDNLPDFFSDLGLSAPVEDLDEDNVEQILVPAARQRIAMDRQQLLATMVMMGINRLVVTDGNISASVLFRLDTRDVVTREFTQTAEQAGHKRKRTRPGFWGWFSPKRTRESEFGRFKVSTVQEEDSEASIRMRTTLKGNVNVNFRSETFPLERMADVLQVNQIREKVPGIVPPGETSPPADQSEPSTRQ